MYPKPRSPYDGKIPERHKGNDVEAGYQQIMQVTGQTYDGSQGRNNQHQYDGVTRNFIKHPVKLHHEEQQKYRAVTDKNNLDVIKQTHNCRIVCQQH